MTRTRFSHRCRRLRPFLPLLLALSLLGIPGRALAEPPPTNLPRGFVQEAVVNGLSQPTAFAFAPDGRIFITEHSGRVRVVHNGVLQEEPFLDIRYKVNSFFQRGLMGVAVHPRWPAAPYVYLAYTYEPPEAEGHKYDGARVSRVVRVSADPNNLNRALPDSEVVILGTNSTFQHIGSPDRMNKKPYSCLNPDGSYVRDCVPNEGNSHTLSHLTFGRDGALYVASGDGINYNSANLRAQSVDSLAGKILRINPMNGNGYPSNPFYDGDPGSNRSKVFALGLRNPWGLTFQPGSGALVVANVGKDKYEEIERGWAGANFGWPCFEGPLENASDPICQPLLRGEQPVTQAVYAYPHTEGRGSVIGGDFVRGRNFPASFRGAYFYSDFNRGTIDYLLFNRDGTVTPQVFGEPAAGISQLTFGRDGALYVLYYVNGSLARIRYTGGRNNRPTAVLAASPGAGDPPLEVRFSSQGSQDPDGDPLQFYWTFGDGESSRKANPVHVYQEAGRYPVRLQVTDSQGASRTATVTIQVGSGELPQETVSAQAGESRPPTPPPPQEQGEEPGSLAQPALGSASSALEETPAPEGGARILLLAGPGYEGLWSVVQWQDGAGAWHDVEGWRGQVEGGRKRWWVGPNLYGHGPFRWQIFDREGGRLLLTSPAFDLPESADQMLVWKVGR